jgi:NAD-dependent dihydropyrimidine dehydrogenase PreA subunit
VFDGTRCVLCGGCVDVCPTLCLKIVALEDIGATAEVSAAIDRTLGADADRSQNAAILKDEDRCIRCALCAMRCPVDAITMERVQFAMKWSEA